MFPGAEVIKTHPALDEWFGVAAPTVLTVRDPRDVVASLYRVRLLTDGRDPWGPGTPADLEGVMGYARRQFDALPRWPGLILRYEAFWNNWAWLFMQLEGFFAVRVSPNRRRRIERKCNREANRQRADRLDGWSSVDSTSLIHGGHVGPARPGSWATTLPDELHAPMFEFLHHQIARWAHPDADS